MTGDAALMPERLPVPSVLEYKNALPCAEAHAPVHYRDGQRRVGKRGLYMRGHINHMVDMIKIWTLKK